MLLGFLLFFSFLLKGQRWILLFWKGSGPLVSSEKDYLEFGALVILPLFYSVFLLGGVWYYF